MVRIAADTLCESCSIPPGTSPQVNSVPLFREESKNAAEMTDDCNWGVSPLAPCKTEIDPRSKDRVAADIEDTCNMYSYSSGGNVAPALDAASIRSPV